MGEKRKKKNVQDEEDGVGGEDERGWEDGTIEEEWRTNRRRRMGKMVRVKRVGRCGR